MVRSTITGAVVSIEHVTDARRDFDWCRFFARPIWLLVIVLGVLVGLHQVLERLGSLLLLLSIFLLCLLGKFFLPRDPWAFIHDAALLKILRLLPNSGCSARFLRLYTDHGDEVTVQMKGNPILGNITVGDELMLQGTWRDGLFVSRRAYNYRTNSWIEMQSAQSWVSLAAGTLLLITFVQYLYIALHWSR